MKKIQGFDILKIVSASLIVFHHYQQVFKLDFAPINFYGGGFNFGYFVELFFIISGFLTLYSAKAGGGGTARAILRKLLRIFPMATIACLLTLIVKSIATEDIGSLWDFKALVANFFLVFAGWPFLEMTGYNNPTWYLCVLIQCYLLFYLIEWIVKKGVIKRLYLIFVGGVLVISLYYVHFLPESSYRGLEAFLIGFGLCEVKDIIPRKRLIVIMILILSVVAIVIVPSQQRRILVFILFPALTMICYWWNGVKNEKFIRCLCMLGGMSFEVYLFHYPLMTVEQMVTRTTGYVFAHSYITMMGFLIIVWVFAFVMYKWVEMPINRKIRKGI